VVDVTDRAHVHVWLGPLEFILCHVCLGSVAGRVTLVIHPPPHLGAPADRLVSCGLGVGP
jgi:hypothetical protein